jgi:hypothetical protein
MNASMTKFVAGVVSLVSLLSLSSLAAASPPATDSPKQIAAVLAFLQHPKSSGCLGISTTMKVPVRTKISGFRCDGNYLLQQQYPDALFTTFYQQLASNELHYANDLAVNLAHPGKISPSRISDLFGKIASTDLFALKERWIAQTPSVLTSMQRLGDNTFWFNAGQVGYSCQFETLIVGNKVTKGSNVYCENPSGEYNATLTGAGKVQVCHGHQACGSNGPTGAVSLPDQNSVSNGLITCSVTTDTVQCRSSAGAGFLMATNKVTILK